MPTTVYDLGDDMSSDPYGYGSTFSGRRTTPSVGDTIDLGGGCTALFVSVDGNIHGGGYVDPGANDNARSIGLLIQYGGFHYLTMGDLPGYSPNVEGPLGEALAADGYNIDILRVSHHGSANSTKNAFVADILPEFAVITCGDGNTYDHPRQFVINHLKALDDVGSPYSPAYNAVTTIYGLEAGDTSDPGGAVDTVVGNGHATDPAEQEGL